MTREYWLIKMERIAQGQGKYTVCTCNFTIRYIYISSIVNEAIKTFKPVFFYEKILSV